MQEKNKKLLKLQKGINENQINQKLSKVNGYLGTFAIDELETLRISHYPSFIVINLDKREHGGSHWIAIAMYLNDIYVCDSLGTILPEDSFPQLLINFLYRVSFRRQLHITQQLQSLNSTYCGLYCIYFIKCMSSASFSDFLSKFSCDYALNDLIVNLYAKNF